MHDLEKVIKGLECCKRKDGNECKVCPYTESEYCTEDMVTDALVLLKEREDPGKELESAMELIHKKNERLEKQKAEIRQLRLALDIMKGNGIKVDTEGR